VAAIGVLCADVAPAFGELQYWVQDGLNANQRQMIRGRVGVSRFGMAGMDQTPDRSAWGLDLGVEISLSSRMASGAPGLTFYDAAHADLLAGWLAQSPLQYGRVSKEHGISFGLTSGLLVMIGWRLPDTSGVFLGVDPMLLMEMVGETSSEPTVRWTLPAAARLDWCYYGTQHLVGMAWAGTNGYLAGSLDLIFTRRLGLYASYSRVTYAGASVPLSDTNPQGNDSKAAKGSVIAFGWRMGNWK
jgi:hypothetical protein